MTSLSAGRGQTSLIKGQTSLMFGQTSASALSKGVPAPAGYGLLQLSDGRYVQNAAGNYEIVRIV